MVRHKPVPMRRKLAKLAALAGAIALADLFIPGVAADEVVLQILLFLLFGGAILLKH